VIKLDDWVSIKNLKQKNPAIGSRENSKTTLIQPLHSQDSSAERFFT